MRKGLRKRRKNCWNSIPRSKTSSSKSSNRGKL